MKKDLTVSSIHRENILNNNYAIEEMQKNLGVETIFFEDDFWLTKKQVQSFYSISDSTIERYLDKHVEELNKSGYRILRGNPLKTFKEASGTLINEGTKITVLGIFNFRAFLNLGMLLTDSEEAKLLRSNILDIVVDMVNQKVGGHTKYINQRDEDFIVNLIKGEDYRKEFTDALDNYIDMGNWKYAIYTNKIYKIIFQEDANEYKNILKLSQKENIRDTMYSEVLDLIAGLENGIANMLKQAYIKKKAKLSKVETDAIFKESENNPFLHPLIEKARNKMASRDLCFRDAFHHKLQSYISAVPKEDFERFLGEKSKELTERIEESKEVFKRLKDR